MNEMNKNELIEALQSENEDLKTRLQNAEKEVERLTNENTSMQEALNNVYRSLQQLDPTIYS